MRPLNFHTPYCGVRFTGVVPSMIRNCKLGAGSQPKPGSGNKKDPESGQNGNTENGSDPSTIPYNNSEVIEKPPPWEVGGAMSPDQFAAYILPWIGFSLVFSYAAARELYFAASTNGSTRIGRIWNVIQNHDSEAYRNFTQKTARIFLPTALACNLIGLIGTIVLYHKGKKAKQYTFSDYYFAHAHEDNQRKDWMKDIFIAPAAMQNLSHEYWSAARGLARTMAEADKVNGKTNGEILTDAVKRTEKMLDWQAQIVAKIKKKKSMNDPEVIDLIEAYQTELDKICQLRAAINNTTKSAKDIVTDRTLTHEGVMDHIIELLMFQSTMTKKNRNGQTDSDKGVLYWLRQYVENGSQAPKEKNERIKKADKFWININEYAKWLGFRPQDSKARVHAAQFLKLLAFGTAEEVWNSADMHYQECEKASPAVATSLPGYLDAMEKWAKQHPEKAEKNFTAHGRRYPVLSAGSY